MAPEVEPVTEVKSMLQFQDLKVIIVVVQVNFDDISFVLQPLKLSQHLTASVFQVILLLPLQLVFFFSKNNL